MGFKYFLLHEDTVYLAQRVGDVLNALQELEQNADALGSRQMTRGVETVVNQIRRILHTAWPKEDEKYLKDLQKVGVGLMKAVEEKDDLPAILSSCSSELQQVMKRLGEPVNQLATPEDKMAHDEESPDQTGKSEKPDRKPPEQPEQQQQQQGQTVPPPIGPPGQPPVGAGVTQPGAQGMPGFSLPGQ